MGLDLKTQAQVYLVSKYLTYYSFQCSASNGYGILNIQLSFSEYISVEIYYLLSSNQFSFRNYNSPT